MSGQKSGSRQAMGFFLSILFFLLCVAAGMFFSCRLDGELSEALCSYLEASVGRETSFKQIFSNAAGYDFKYSLIVLVFSLSVTGSFFPLVLIGFKGFSAGLAVSIAARVIDLLSGRIAFSAVIFISSVLTVPVYVLMFMTGFKFAVRLRKSTDSKGPKFKAYMEFLLFVAMFFVILCVIDCIQASIGMLILCFFK